MEYLRNVIVSGGNERGFLDLCTEQEFLVGKSLVCKIDSHKHALVRAGRIVEALFIIRMMC